MKRAGLQRSKATFVAALLLLAQLLFIPFEEAQATNDVQASCVIGSSSTCPAQSPQEIYNLYGTTANGTYWLNVNGTATQTYLVMDTNYPDGGHWFLGMKGTKTSSNFNYSSGYWTSQSSTLNTSSLSNDVSTDAKFDAFNYLPVTKIVGVFKDRSSYAFNTNGSGVLGTNSFGGHTWKEDISSQNMFTRFTNNSILYSATGAMTRYDLYRESNSSSANLVFAHQTGYAKYGFAYNNGAATYRWGIAFNNENDDPRIDSSDAQAGFGLSGNGAASVLSYSDSLSYSINGSTGLNNGATATYASGFQIWGKMAAPSLATPGSLSVSNLGSGSVRLDFAAASGATEYAVQYKSAGSNWSAGTTVRLTNPGASPSATLTGLTSGSYDFRVFSRATNNSSSGNSYLLAQAIDATAPVVSDTTFASTPGGDSIYGLGETITIRMTFSETVTVTGTPRIPIQGLTSKYATYSSGTGSKVLDFKYGISPGDEDSNGVSITGSSLDLNGGTIEDLALNDATLTFAGLGAASFTVVDGVTPTVSTIATAVNGQSVIITLTETQSASALTASPFAISVNGVRDTVTVVTQSGPRVTLTLTFGVIAGDTVQATYTDPTSSNDTSALQDLAGNDVATFTMSVTNSSTSASNTSITLALNPASATAVYRVNNSIVATVNTPGKVDFKLQGKILPGCRNISTTGSNPITAICTWKPSLHSAVKVTATFKPSGSGFSNSSAAPLALYVVKRTNTR